MATFSSLETNYESKFYVAVSVPPAIEALQTYVALMDTGAQATGLSPKLAEDLNLIPHAIAQLMPASGKPFDTFNYRVRIDLPIKTTFNFSGGNLTKGSHLHGMKLDGFRLPYQPETYDVLLGMDFVSMFHITMYGNRFIIGN